MSEKIRNYCMHIFGRGGITHPSQSQHNLYCFKCQVDHGFFMADLLPHPKQISEDEPKPQRNTQLLMGVLGMLRYH